MPDTSTLKPHSLPPFGLTPRSVIIGLVGVAIQCLVTPYNDFLVGGTYLAGNRLRFINVMINEFFNRLPHGFAPSSAYDVEPDMNKSIEELIDHHIDEAQAVAQAAQTA